MYYGDEKARQMARSILPSRARKSARDNLRAIKQRHRSRVRQELRLIDEDNEVRDAFDPHGYPMGAIRREVRERRDADKLSHFEKWAIEVTKDIPEPDGRVAKMRGLLPAGLIGDHAMSHLANYREFEPDAFRYGRDPYRAIETPAERAAAEEAAREARHARRVRLLREIVATGWGHALLNQQIRHSTVSWPVWREQVPTRHPSGVNGEYVTRYEDRFVETEFGPTRPRKLMGLGDVEPFLDALLRARGALRLIKVPERLITREVRPARYFYFNPNLPKHTYVYEYVSNTRPNPESHPEWLESVDKFLDDWEAAKGDEATMRRKYRTW